ncbi:FadR/GntR family transcriptional regulator [Martelella sp. HB161492]|uniref:FadR/GntR family transcriptional regulator n=1 Tax=Martelella sp. HB161492 TaxID=2720726 RepID=UPI001590AB5E|nr:FadR/GntR family transcriptional regulator [Martelella sp. HB161492]
MDVELSDNPPGSAKSVPARVGEAIQDIIRKSGLENGDKIPSERTLSAMLAVSRTSVREAISMLEALGLVRVEVGRGIFVATPRRFAPVDQWRYSQTYSLKEIYQFRLAVEPIALRHAARHLTAADVRNLRTLSQAYAAAAACQDPIAAAEQDRMFHDLIYQRCENRLIRETLEGMAAMIQSSQWAPLINLDTLHEAGEEHMKVVIALEAGDLESAVEALADHIRRVGLRCGIATL